MFIYFEKKMETNLEEKKIKKYWWFSGWRGGLGGGANVII
jgi:hypothetical protein